MKERGLPRATWVKLCDQIWSKRLGAIIKEVDHEIENIRELGVQFITSHTIDLGNEINELRDDFDATILAIGSSADRKLGVKGEELSGVEGGVSFLKSLHQEKVEKLDSKVAVIGDGNRGGFAVQPLEDLRSPNGVRLGLGGCSCCEEESRG